ncbi:MAG: hypothetical protein ACOYXB_10760 [Bacteroidota bacterium]
MKRKVLFLTFFFCSINLSAQPNHLGFVLGYRYTPLEYLGGPSLGLHYQIGESAFGIGYRYEAIGKISRLPYSITQRLNYEILHFYSFNYLTLDYRVSERFSLETGPGWTYDGWTDNILLNGEFGYSVLTLCLNYKFEWLNIQVRGDIPLEQYFERRLLTGFVFPLSLCLTHTFAFSE